MPDAARTPVSAVSVGAAVRLIRVSRLEPNPWNPNILPDDQRARLRRSIRKRGFVLPVLIRKIGPECYQIIDGQHRVDLARDEFHFQRVPCIVLDVSEAVARELTINLNYLRGEPEWDRYAEMLDWFVQHGKSAEDLTKTLPLTHVEVDEMLASIHDKLPDAEKLAEKALSDRRQALRTERLYHLTFGPFTLSEKDLIEEILDDEHFDDIVQGDLIVRLFKLGARKLLRKQLAETAHAD